MLKIKRADTTDDDSGTDNDADGLLVSSITSPALLRAASLSSLKPTNRSSNVGPPSSSAV